MPPGLIFPLRRLLLFFSFFFYVVTGFSQHPGYFERLMDKGLLKDKNVKEVRVYKDVVSDSTIQKKRLINKNGKSSAFFSYEKGSPDSIPTRVGRFKYGDDGNLKFSTDCTYMWTKDGGKFIYSELQYQYSNGRVKRITGKPKHYEKVGYHYEVHHYDKKGRVKRIVEHDTIDRDKDEMVYYYNPSGKKRMRASSKEGQLDYYEVFRYDSLGQLESKYHKNVGEDRKTFWDEFYRYNEEGKLLRENSYGYRTSLSSRVKFEYGPDGLLRAAKLKSGTIYRYRYNKY